MLCYFPCSGDGDWNTWGQWSMCSVSCGVGLEHRVRSCTNPVPGSDGHHCFGDSKDYRVCFSACAGMFLFYVIQVTDGEITSTKRFKILIYILIGLVVFFLHQKYSFLRRDSENHVHSFKHMSQ